VNKALLTTEQIHELADKRIRQNQARNEWYYRQMSYWLGTRARDLSKQMQNIKAMDSKGRVLLRDQGVGGTTKVRSQYYSNRVAPVANDYQAILGRVPRLRVPPENEVAPNSLSKAEKQTRWCLSTSQLSHFDMQQAEVGFYLPVCGDALYVCEVDVPDDAEQQTTAAEAESGTAETKNHAARVAITSVPPEYGHPSFMKGFRRFEMYDLCIIYHEDPDVLIRDYGYDPEAPGNGQNNLLITYISPWQRTVVAGKETLAHVEWDLGFCPAEWCFNQVAFSGTPAQYGNSDIGQILGLQDHHNWAKGVASDALVYATYPITHLQNILSFGDDTLEVGPGALVISESGRVEIAGYAANPGPANQMAQDAERDIYAGSGTSSVRIEGDQHSSIQTGRGIHAAQGPQATRIDLKQAIIGYHIERIFSKAMEMQERAPYLGETFEMESRRSEAVTREQFDPKIDIAGWYSVVATWDTMLGMNRQQRIMMAAQAKQFGLIDDLEAMEMAGVEDPLRMRTRVEEMHKREQAMEQGAQPQPGQGAAAAPGGGPPHGRGGGPPRSLPFKPPGLGTPGQPQLASGVPLGVSLPAVEDALRKVVDQLKGEVYAQGELADIGQSTMPMIYVTVLADQQVVQAVLKPIVASVKVKFAKTSEAIPGTKVRVG
jgi:hypothetical protein